MFDGLNAAATKTCTQCDVDKSLPEFGKLARRKDGINTRCKACERAYFAGYRAEKPTIVRACYARWFSANQDVARVRNAAWRAANPDRQLAAEQRYIASNPKKVRASKARWRKANPDKQSAATKRWSITNSERRAAQAAARRSLKLQATPVWVTADDLLPFYVEAKGLTAETDQPHHVDHIVPLKSKWVCGLHCPANLEVIPGPDNLAKGNRRWPDMGALTP